MRGGARQWELSHRGLGDRDRGGVAGRGQSERNWWAGPAGKGTKIQLHSTFWWWPVVLGAPWPRAALLRSVPRLTWPPPVCVPVSSLLLRSPPVSEVWSTPIQYNLISLHLQRPCLQVSSGSEAPHGHAFWGHHFPQHTLIFISFVLLMFYYLFT